MTRIPTDIVIIILFFLEIVRQSIFSEVVGNAVINSVIILGFVVIIISSKLSRSFYIFLLLLIIVLMSVLANTSVIETGGYNSLVILVSCFGMMSMRVTHFNSSRFLACMAFLTFVFLVVLYFFYFFNLQPMSDRFGFILRGPYLNQNTTAMILFSLFVILIIFNFKNSRLINLLIAIVIFSILLTQSRSAILSSFLLLFYHYFRRYKFKMIYIGLIYFGLIGSYVYSQEDILQRLIVRLTESGSSGRLQLWGEALIKITADFKSLLFGLGVNQLVMQYNASNLSVHNSYIAFFANYGLIATLTLILSIIYMLVNVSHRSFTLFVALSGILLFGLFETVLFGSFSSIWLSFIFLYYLREQTFKKHAYSNRTF